MTTQQSNAQMRDAYTQYKFYLCRSYVVRRTSPLVAHHRVPDVRKMENRQYTLSKPFFVSETDAATDTTVDIADSSTSRPFISNNNISQHQQLHGTYFDKRKTKMRWNFRHNASEYECEINMCTVQRNKFI